MQTLKHNFMFQNLDESENWGQLFPLNYTGTGMMGEFLKHKADIAVGNLKPDLDRHIIFDYTVQYMHDATIQVVSVADIIPNWRKMFLVFTPTVWAASAIVYLLVSIIVYLLGIVAMKNEQKEHVSYRSCFWSFICNIRSSCGQFNWRCTNHKAKNFFNVLEFILYSLVHSIYNKFSQFDDITNVH